MPATRLACRPEGPSLGVQTLVAHVAAGALLLSALNLPETGFGLWRVMQSGGRKSGWRCVGGGGAAALASLNLCAPEDARSRQMQLILFVELFLRTLRFFTLPLLLCCLLKMGGAEAPQLLEKLLLGLAEGS